MKGRQFPGLRPEELLTFVEIDGFTRDWRDLGLNDDDLLDLQISIMLRPQGWPLIPGTDGLRKMRFAPARWGTGKRGAIRVCYVHFADVGVVLLVVAFAKNQKANLSPADKKAVRDLIRREKAI